MNIAFYTATTGMIAQQQGMDIYANNVSNVNTVGYKDLRPSFAECIYTEQRATEPEWDTGHGQFVNKTDFMWDIGGFVNTESALDYAITGDGFFMVTDYNGKSYLTRDGSFDITNVGDHWELVNGNGDFVLDANGDHITVPFVTETDENGEEIATTDIDYNALTKMIGVYEVPNNFGLIQDDSNHFVVTERSGEATADPDANSTIMEYYLEQSSVDLAEEMVHIIETQRSYQLDARLIQTADEMQQIANNLR